jgi:hypothetical protein
MLAWLKNRTAREVRPVHAGRFEPLRPVAPVIEVQQHVMPEGEGLAQRIPAAQEPRTADRKQRLGAQPRHPSPGHRPSPWRTATSTSSRAKSTWCSDALIRRSMLGWASAKRPRRCTSHLAAKFGDVVTVRTPALCRCAPRLGDDEPLALTVEEGKPEFGLKGLHLVADCTPGDAQLVRCPGETLVAGGGLEGLERVQRRQPAGHGTPS